MSDLLASSFPSFIEWAWRRVDPAPFVPNWHIWRMAEYLQAVAEGDIPNLLIGIPPGHQKSLTVSVFWHPWTWIARPHMRFMTTSYSGDLALRDSDRSRELIRDLDYQRLFGDRYQLRRGQNVKSRYQNDKRGYRYATAISGIMGEGGDIVVLDDPHNVDTAESDDVRDETVRKIKLALPTRVRSKQGGVVVMMQRLHERDFAGALIDKATDEGMPLVHLCLPARYEYDHPHVTRTITLPSGRILKGDDREDADLMRQVDAARAAGGDDAKKNVARIAAEHNGDLLFPGLFSEERIATLELTMGAYGAAGQLQQRPTAREGGLFKRAWIYDHVIEASDLPRGRLAVRGWDLAGTDAKRSPYTAGVKMSVHNGIYYVESVRRFQGEPGDVETAIKECAQADGRAVYVDIPQDPGQAGKAQVRALTRLLAGFAVRSSPESGSKVQRAEPLASQCQHGNVMFVRGEWLDAYAEELCAFPGGRYADQVDASSRAFARLLEMGGAVQRGIAYGSY